MLANETKLLSGRPVGLVKISGGAERTGKEGQCLGCGTRAPLAEVLESVADGQPFLEIAKVFELTLQQLIAVLQFAAESAAASAASR